MFLTIQHILDLPVVRAGRPAVRAGRSRLATRVRWVHVSELADPAGTLSGGELVLSVGAAAAGPATDPGVYVTALRDAGAVGLAIELGQHLRSLPDGLVQAARSADFPLVELRRSVRFVEITELVHAEILNEQFARMRRLQSVNATLWALTVDEAGIDRIVQEAASMLDVPVVLEDLAHRALCFAGDAGAEVVLRDWMARSRQAHGELGGPEGWLTAPVGARGRRWGRVVVPHRISGDADGGEEADLTATVLDLVADAVTVAQARGGSVAPELPAQRRLLQDLLGAPTVDADALRARARALGLAVDGGFSVVVVVTEPDGESDAVAAAVDATARERIPALCGALGPGRVGLVMSRSGAADPEVITRFLRGLPTRCAQAVAAGTPAATFDELADALLDACHVADVVAASDSPARHRPWRRADLGAHGLLWELRGDPRLAAFADEHLGSVLRLRGQERDALLTTLRAYVEAGGVMTDFARRIGTSRPAAYDRLAKLTKVLGRDPADPAQRLALHIAVLALDVR